MNNINKVMVCKKMWRHNQSMVAFLGSALSSAAVSDLRSVSKTFLSFVLLSIDVDVEIFCPIAEFVGMD